MERDYFDWDVGRVNQPDRSLSSGRISAAELWTLFFLFTAAGLAIATLLGSLVLVLAAAVLGVALLYNMKLAALAFLFDLGEENRIGCDGCQR
jgi:4-hydroxybenzoate polyprenyltransferase